DLVVTAAASVQLAAEIAQLVNQGALDVGVNVFQLDGKGKLAAVDAVGNFGQTGHDGLGVFTGEQADFGKHAGMGLAGTDVVAGEGAVEADRLGEGFDPFVGAAAEAAAPGLLTHGRLLTACPADTPARRGGWRYVRQTAGAARPARPAPGRRDRGPRAAPA